MFCSCLYFYISVNCTSAMQPAVNLAESFECFFPSCLSPEALCYFFNHLHIREEVLFQIYSNYLECISNGLISAPALFMLAVD